MLMGLDEVKWPFLCTARVKALIVVSRGWEDDTYVFTSLGTKFDATSEAVFGMTKTVEIARLDLFAVEGEQGVRLASTGTCRLRKYESGILSDMEREGE
jgi:hypothetical protein